MAVVKGSEQDRLVIQHYKPWERTKSLLYFALCVIAVALGSYFAGLYGSMDIIQSLRSERDTLQARLDEAEVHLADATQKISVLEKGGEVDRQASEGVRQTVKDLKNQIATLQEEVAFYKSTLRPASNDKGLRVSKMDVTALDTPNRYRYSVTLAQVTDNSSYIAGIAAISVVGVRNGEQVSIPLRDLDPSVSELGVKFRFRYFQEVAGEVSLPDQFKPEQLQVVLQASGDKAQRVEQTAEWPR